MSKESYVIEAGATDRPETVEVGRIEKGTGQTILVGETAKILSKRADIGIPNYTEAWGVRLDKDGNIPEKPIDVKNVNYTGQIKELTWGDKRGSVIICRWLEGYPSIDKLYQDLVLNASSNIRDDDESSAKAFYIRLQSGDNFFDPEADKYLTQMLRVHYLNGSSKSRNPGVSQQMYVEVADATEQKNAVTYNAKFEALKLVNEASTDNTLGKLKNLLSIVNIIGTEEPKDSDLLRYLSYLADTKTDLFLAQVELYKRELSDMFEKAKSYKAIDLTKDGIISAGVTKSEPLNIGKEIPAKKEKMLDWLMDNFLDTNAADIILKLKQITDKLN